MKKGTIFYQVMPLDSDCAYKHLIKIAYAVFTDLEDIPILLVGCCSSNNGLDLYSAKGGGDTCQNFGNLVSFLSFFSRMVGYHVFFPIHRDVLLPDPHTVAFRARILL